MYTFYIEPKVFGFHIIVEHHFWITLKIILMLEIEMPCTINSMKTLPKSTKSYSSHETLLLQMKKIDVLWLDEPLYDFSPVHVD